MLIVTIIVSVVLVALDRAVKYWAASVLAPMGYLTLIPKVLEFRYVENSGAAFSILEGRQIFLIVASGILLLAVGFVLFVRRPKDKLEYASLLLIFAGGIGNFIDRVLNGFVVDYINVLFMRFAVFNLADCFVVVGGVLLVVAFVRQEMRERREAKRGAAAEQAEMAMLQTEMEVGIDTADGED